MTFTSIDCEEYPPALTASKLEYLFTSFTDWSLAHGLAVRPPGTAQHLSESVLATHAPVTLFPSPFPRAPFDQARGIQTVYNELYANIASDDSEQWLAPIIEELVCSIPFHSSPCLFFSFSSTLN